MPPYIRDSDASSAIASTRSRSLGKKAPSTPAAAADADEWLDGYEGWFGSPIASVIAGSACVGRMTFSSEATQVLAQSIAQPQIAGEQLTERECDVLKCMVEGLNNNEIAERLVVSLGTVKFHISNIFHKLGVDSRVEAVKLAIEQKLT